MVVMWVKNMPLKVGHTLTVTGFPKAGTDHFVLDIYSGANITLHMDVRFNLHSHERVMLCNSWLEEVWGEQVIHRTFPFNYDELFKFTVTLTLEDFLVLLSDGSEVHFPNRLGASEYKNFSFDDGVVIRSFEIN